MRIVFLLIALAGCIETSVVQCTDGRTCPAGTQCHATYALCISTEQQTACAALADGDACMADDIGGECFDGLCIKPLCGDGLVTSDEQCDHENVDGATCVDLAWYEGALTCDASCRFVETACNGRCGDGVVNGAESCDGVGTRPAYSTCLTFGFDAGELGCSTGCEPGLDECARLYWLATDLQMEAYSIHGAGDLLLAVGRAGEIRRFGVLGWTLMTSGTTVDLDDVFVADSANAWVVGKGGLILHFDGLAWSQVASSTTADLRGVWAASSTDAFAVGAGGVILHWNGSAWSAMTSPTNLDLEDIWGFSGSDVHVAGTGQALRYNGTAWTINGGFPTTQHAIWGAAPNDVWMGGGYGDTNGELHHWNGTTWTTETIAGMGDVFSIWGTSSDNVYFAPYLHGLYHWNGQSLTKFVAPVFFVRALGGRGPDELFASTFTVGRPRVEPRRPARWLVHGRLRHRGGRLLRVWRRRERALGRVLVDSDPEPRDERWVLAGRIHE